MALTDWCVGWAGESASLAGDIGPGTTPIVSTRPLASQPVSPCSAAVAYVSPAAHYNSSMSAAPEALDQLVESLRRPVAEYAHRMREHFGTHLLSLAIYGPASTAAYDARRDAVRSAAVFDAIDWELLWQLAGHGVRLARHGLTPPMVFTPDHLRRSCDTFPLEFLEIQQQHVTLFGDDFFAPLVFQDRDIQRQCERELKVISIALHQRLLASGGRKRRLKRFGHELTEHLARTLRGMLWLKGQREPFSNRQVIEHTETLIGRPLPGVCSVAGETESTAWQEFRDLYADVQVLEQYADGL